MVTGIVAERGRVSGNGGMRLVRWEELLGLG